MKTELLLSFAIAVDLAAAYTPDASALNAATGTQLSAASVNSAVPADPADAGASQAAVLRAQILLDRAHFSPGEIDAAYGGNMRKAITAYQQSNSLPGNGVLDAATWNRLNEDDVPALAEYVITEADVAGPFVSIPSSMAGKSKLPALGYGSALEALAEKFHASPRLLRRLNVSADFSRAGEKISVPNVLSPEPMPAAAKIVVDRSDASVSVLDAGGRILARYPASTGSSYDPLPVGVWKIQGIARNPVFNYNPKLFWDAKASSVKAKIAPGPNNPVGVVWIDLSKEHYGIHGTPEPSKIGKTESHGCIRLSNWNADALASAVSPGMTALLQE